MRSERLGEGVSAGGDAVSGNHLPNPLPLRVRRHSSTAQTPAKRVRRPREHARGGTVWQCRLRSTSSLREQETALGDQRAGRRRRSHAGAAESRHRALRTEEQRPGALRRSDAGSDAAAVFSCSPAPVARVVFGTSAPRPPVHPPAGYRHPTGACRPPAACRILAAAARTYGRSHSARVARRSNDGFRLAQPYIFSQLLTPADSLVNWPINPLATRQEETRRYASTRRGRATNTRRTSLRGFWVKRFVIECFPPSCLVDIVLVGQLVTPAPRDAVDSILGAEDWGLAQDRGEMCRSDRPVRTRETRTPRGA